MNSWATAPPIMPVSLRTAVSGTPVRCPIRW